MKSIFAGAAFKLLIAAAIAIVLVNDVGSLVSTRYLLDGRAKEIGERAAEFYDISRSPAQAQAEAEALALRNDSIITSFEIVNKSVVKFNIEIPNRETWVAHRIEAFRPYLNAHKEYSRSIYR